VRRLSRANRPRASATRASPPVHPRSTMRCSFVAMCDGSAGERRPLKKIEQNRPMIIDILKTTKGLITIGAVLSAAVAADMLRAAASSGARDVEAV
jgi:hypothetical protein